MLNIIKAVHLLMSNDTSQRSHMIMLEQTRMSYILPILSLQEKSNTKKFNQLSPLSILFIPLFTTLQKTFLKNAVCTEDKERFKGNASLFFVPKLDLLSEFKKYYVTN